MSAQNPKLLRAASILMLVSSILMLAAGAYITLARGDTIGVVFVSLGGAFAALCAVFGGLAKQKSDDHAG